MRNVKKLAVLLTATTLFGSALTGCGVQGSIADTAENTAVEAPAATDTAEKTETAATEAASDVKENHGKLSVSYPNGNIRATVNIIALNKGYFEEEGVEIEAIAIGGNDALTAINEESGQLDILNVGFVPDVQAIGAGYDLTFFGGTAVEGGAVIAKKGNADKFKGTDKLLDFDAFLASKLGFVRNESAWVIARQYLLDNGVDNEAIKAIEDEASGNILYYGEPIETAQAVQKGEIELGFLPMEFALLYADAYDLEIVAAAGDLSPNYVCCREVTSKKRYSEKYDAFVAYEKARIKAFEYYKLGETDETVKADVVKIAADYSGKELDYVETYLYGGVTKLAVDPNATGIAKFIEAANNSGLLASSETDFGTYDISKDIDTSAYKAALDELIAQNPDNAFYADLLAEYNAAN